MSFSEYLIICINYYSNSSAVNFVHQALELNDAYHLQIIVVDNTEKQKNSNELYNLTQDSRVTILTTPVNLGYFGGASYGLNYFLSNNPLPQWIIVSNVDITLEDQNLLIKLDEIADKENTNIGVVAPSIIAKPSGFDQNPYIKLKITNRKIRFYQLIFRFYPLFWLYESIHILKKLFMQIYYFLSLHRFPVLNSCNHMNLEPEKNAINIYAPHGSFILFHKRYFLNGGNLNFKSFLFWEEIFVAETCKANNLSILYYPDIIVSHKEHISTGWRKSKKMISFMLQSLEYCRSEFFNK